MRKALNVSVALGFIVAFAAMHLRCHQVIMTAPPNSSLELTANPIFIPANGGVSVITAFLLGPTGSPVHDGTVVQFFTDLGQIPEQAKTNDGVARVNLISDARSGVAHVQAFSGGQASGGGTSSTTTPTTTVGVGGQSSGSAAAFAAGLAAAQASDNIDVSIGTVLPKRIQVTAVPSFLSDRRATTITANVYDERGNPVANVPIIFTVAEGSSTTPPTTTPTTTPVARGTSAGTLEEFMDSQGTPTFTDNNGQAKDVMRTRADFDEFEKTVTVTATAPTGVSGNVQIVINPGIVPTTTTTNTTLSTAPTTIAVVASPAQMNAATLSTSIRATVFNASGGLVRNVPVIFSVAVVAGTPNGETLASGGSPVVTNASGQAQDTLTIAAASARTLRVTARTGSISSTVDIPVT